MASLSPIEMSSINHKILAAWFESLVTELHQSSWITSLEAERAERQYKELLENKDAMKEMKLFEMKDRVDTFLSKILGRESPDLTKVIRIILIMSHGNASVESGFSVNGDIILPNMLEETIVAQIIVSFLPKILGRNQDFPKGSVLGEVIFQSAWGERVLERNLNFQ